MHRRGQEGQPGLRARHVARLRSTRHCQPAQTRVRTSSSSSTSADCWHGVHRLRKSTSRKSTSGAWGRAGDQGACRAGSSAAGAIAHPPPLLSRSSLRYQGKRGAADRIAPRTRRGASWGVAGLEAGKWTQTIAPHYSAPCFSRIGQNKKHCPISSNSVTGLSRIDGDCCLLFLHTFADGAAMDGVTFLEDVDASASIFDHLRGRCWQEAGSGRHSGGPPLHVLCVLVALYLRCEQGCTLSDMWEYFAAHRDALASCTGLVLSRAGISDGGAWGSRAQLACSRPPARSCGAGAVQCALRWRKACCAAPCQQSCGTTRLTGASCCSASCSAQHLKRCFARCGLCGGQLLCHSPRCAACADPMRCAP